MDAIVETPTCSCPDPALCVRLKRHIFGAQWQHWTNKADPKSQAYRNKWLVEAGLDPETRPNYGTTPFVLADVSRHDCQCRGARIANQPCGQNLVRCTHDDAIVSTQNACKDAKRTCSSCAFYKPASWVARFDERTLHPAYPGKRFNPSLIEHGDGFAFAWRHGWAGSDIHVSLLNARFQPLDFPPVKLPLFHRQANYGREDPRFFWFRDRLHITYVGVVGTHGPTNVLYARLNVQRGQQIHPADWRVEQIFFPQIAPRLSWEKNWAFFEHDGQLYAIYHHHPHRIIRVDGESTEWLYTHPDPSWWKIAGEVRGGAAPVLVNGEWWHFFHSRIERPAPKGRRYCMGLYTFDSKPPFKITRAIPQPIQWADDSSKPADQYAAAVFPCGAVLRDGWWIISSGIHDRWSEIHQFEHAKLEKRLQTV